MARIYATRTPGLDEALAHAGDAAITEPDAADSKKLQGWALYGYERWLADQRREAKLRAYEAIGQDDEHLDDVRRFADLAVEAGLL
ncbi:MAG: hypothetical protein WKF96_21410 [Solirubrobacteraceae bacterium]